jgi:hypothetical protein
VHGAVGGAPAHGSHHGHVGIEGEVEHRFCELWGGAEIAGSAGGEVSTNGEANVSVGLALGHLNLGNGFQVPLPHASLHLADLSREHGVRFLVGEVVVPFGVGIPLDIAGVHVMVTPAIEIVLEFAPNWVNIAPHLTGEAAELAAEGAEAVEAAEVAGAGAETVGAVSAEAEAALVAEIGLAELAVPGAVIIAGAAVGVLAYEWIQDFAHHEHVWAASRANARTLFMYCMGYTSAWCGTGDMGGLGASQGSAAARRDIAAVRARYPGIELAALVRQWGGPQRMYDAIYEVASPVARDWAIEHLHAEGLDVDVIRANIRQTRWGGQLWGQFVGEAGAPTRR